ncbi:MAG: hypothetical protein U0736_02480 [Gemmataceae bacterium]
MRSGTGCSTECCCGWPGCPTPAGWRCAAGYCCGTGFARRRGRALDLDLVAPTPLTVAEAADRYLPLFADAGVADGVTFNPAWVRAQAIWGTRRTPACRLRPRRGGRARATCRST